MAGEYRQQIIDTANALGMSPIDLATVISYESGFDPGRWGGSGGRHFGTIQFGPAERAQYGVDTSNPLSQFGAKGGIANYFRGRGYKPGMSLLDIYSIVNAGGPGKYNASDTAAGGTAGNVRDKVGTFGPHREKALAYLGDAAGPMTADVRTYGGTQGIRADSPSYHSPVGSDLPSQQYGLVRPDTYGGPDEGAKPGPGMQISSDPAPAGGPLGRVVARGVTDTEKDYSYAPPPVPEQPEYRITQAPAAAVTRGEPVSPANPEMLMAQKQQLAALLAQLNGRPMQGGGYGQV